MFLSPFSIRLATFLVVRRLAVLAGTGVDEVADAHVRSACVKIETSVWTCGEPVLLTANVSLAVFDTSGNVLGGSEARRSRGHRGRRGSRRACSFGLCENRYFRLDLRRASSTDSQCFSRRFRYVWQRSWWFGGSPFSRAPGSTR